MGEYFYIIGLILILFNLYNTIKLGKPIYDMYAYKQDMYASYITNDMIKEIVWILFVYGEFGWFIYGCFVAPNYKYFMFYVVAIIIISIIDAILNNKILPTKTQHAIKSLIDACCEIILMYGCYNNF